MLTITIPRMAQPSTILVSPLSASTPTHVYKLNDGTRGQIFARVSRLLAVSVSTDRAACLETLSHFYATGL